MRPRSSSPIVPIYLARKPELAQATIALATCPPGLSNLLDERDLAGVRREMGNDQQGIGGVQADANDVEFGHSRSL